jgi:hypothetical protein
MTVPNEDTRSIKARVLKRTGLVGIALGALALIACEVPLVLAVVGLGGLGAGSTAFAPETLLEFGGIALAISGGVILVALRVRRVRAKRKEAPQ